ncbi:MAG: glutamate--tRNA ligase [Flavobacteriaceae bacterium]|nr:glutamate--tRNA ligase [Flavobacteriaceae bacterium]|tara:strand:+ start:338572 stop:340095 length:1524 start_codon:yes stop_codon:yes gene_type:complete
MSSEVRVRFAPSPTGPLHIGGVRTALYNYLFAKQHNGRFVLRIEDTDQTRYVANAEQYIIDSLNWCRIPFDEGPGKNEKFGPYRQSERKSLYKQYADELIANGKAYYAFDTSEELDAHRKDHEAKGKTFIYNWHNREKGRLVNSLVLSEEETQKRIDNGEKYVVRFKTPQDKKVIFQDIVRGTIEVDSNILDDKILFKSDGMPTYHLANVVDDHLMQISHVIRGEEWLPSLALHNLLYEAFGWEKPEFAHLPLILKPVGKGKLSKRDGDKLGFPVFPLEYVNEESQEVSRGYREDGYFSDAFINMLAFLGWNPGTEQEIYKLDELIKDFDLSRVNKSGAKFSPDKTKWFQQQYMQSKSDVVIAQQFQEILVGKGIETEINFVTTVVGLVKERAVFVEDLWDLSSYFFEAPSAYDPKTSKKQWKETTADLMQELIEQVEAIADFSSENVETQIKTWITSKEIGFGKVMQPLRLSLVGALKGPHLFDIMHYIGKPEVISRLKNAIQTLG